MTLDYSEEGKVQIIMDDYIEGMPEDTDGVAATPAANHLFEINDDAAPLDEETKQMFHHHTAKLLFLCKRARPRYPGAGSLFDDTSPKAR